MNKWIKLGLIIIPVVILGACGTTAAKKSGAGAPVGSSQGQGGESERGNQHFYRRGLSILLPGTIS